MRASSWCPENTAVFDCCLQVAGPLSGSTSRLLHGRRRRRLGPTSGRIGVRRQADKAFATERFVGIKASTALKAVLPRRWNRRAPTVLTKHKIFRKGLDFWQISESVHTFGRPLCPIGLDGARQWPFRHANCPRHSGCRFGSCWSTRIRWPPPPASEYSSRRAIGWYR
jgi:hypothetical protein